VIQTDASSTAIAAVLVQYIDNLHKPVGFNSRKLSSTEANYSASERELLAIVYSLEQFLAYVYGRKTVIYTDHKPLVTAKTLKEPMGKLGRSFFRITHVEFK
jgi:hypothetical protein